MDQQQVLQSYITVVICLIVMVVAIGFLVRAAAGPRGHAAYNRFWGRVIHNTARHFGRFLRWTIRNHWSQWLAFAAGMLLMYIIMSP